MSTSDNDLFNCREAAEILRISLSTLERMRCQGTGPAFIRLGRGRRNRIVYRRSDIDAWLNELRFHSTQEYGR